jgi:uncharacterized protein
VTEPLYASSAPVFKVDGSLEPSLARDLLRLDVEEDREGLKHCLARFLAIGPQADAPAEIDYLDGAVVDFGKKFDVSLGPPGTERIVFSGYVSAIEARFVEGDEPEVHVLAEDKLMRLRMTRRTKTYEQMSDAQIAESIAGEHGLTPDVAADGPTYDVVQQWNQSDLAFLRDRARLIQADLWCEGETLGFKTRGNRTGTTVTLVQGNELVAVDCRADLAHQRTKVTVSGYDASQRATIEQEAGADAVAAETSGGQSGPAVLERAFGERVSRRVRESPLADGEATSWARAEMLRRARGFVQIVGTTRGTPDLVVGSRVTLERVGPPFNGDGYYVTRVRQSYDLQVGHRTHFKAERATVNAGAA